jgi:hypothetical protein
VASLTKQLIEDRDFARSLDNAAAAVTASAAIMKLHGLGSEKVKVETKSVVDYLTDLSRRDIPVEAPVEGERDPRTVRPSSVSVLDGTPRGQP